MPADTAGTDVLYCKTDGTVSNAVGYIGLVNVGTDGFRVTLRADGDWVAVANPVNAPQGPGNLYNVTDY